MKKMLIFFLFFSCFLMIKMWGDINKYDHVLVKRFLIGNENGQIGFNIAAMEGAGRVSPKTFTISNDSKFYIGDIVNNRIVIFDQDIKFERNINSKLFGGIDKKIIVTNEKNVIIYITYQGFFLINQKGEKVQRIYDPFFNKVELSNSNYFYYNDYIFYYDINENLKAADTNNKIYEKAELQTILNELNNAFTVKSWRKLEDNNLRLKVESFIQEKKINMIGNRILNNDYFTHKKYYEFLQNNTTLVTRNIKSTIDLTDLPKPMDVGFINYDTEDNSYWRYMTENRDFLIIIYNKYGELIDAFDTIDYALYDVAPNGDVYVLETYHEAVQANNGYNFYKITRNW